MRARTSWPSWCALTLALFAADCGGKVEVDAPYAELVASDGPTSYWRFGDVTGRSDVRDETGRVPAARTSGVSAGAPGAIAGDADTAFAFDGARAAVVAPDVDGFQGTAPFTVEVWIAPKEGGLPIQRICNHRLGPPHTGWRLFLDETKRVAFERWNDDVILGAVSAPLPVGTYSHVVARYDGAELALFVDGARVSSVPDTGRIGAFSAPLTWGAASTVALDFFTGSLDEGAIYDRALEADRIAAHYRRGKGK